MPAIYAKTPPTASACSWLHLRAHRLQGFKFKRQQPIGFYIVDFVCFEARLIVEADGGHHAEQVEYDTRRDDWLRSQGFTVLRFWNNDILGNTEGVLETILSACRERVDSPSPQPLPRQGGGAIVPNNIVRESDVQQRLDPQQEQKAITQNDQTEAQNSPFPLRETVDATESSQQCSPHPLWETVDATELSQLCSPLLVGDRRRNRVKPAVLPSPLAGEGPGERGRRPMSFPRYESYKDSGVEWLGEVPEHWRRSGFQQFCRSTNPSKSEIGRTRPGQPKFLSYQWRLSETDG